MTEEGLGGITDSMDMNLSKLREIVTVKFIGFLLLCSQ